MKVLCTGSAGFIGSHLVDALIKQEHAVTGVDDFSGSTTENVNQFSINHISDCRDEESMDEIFRINRPEVVYHLAANAAENKAQFSPIDITSRNYDAFIKVLTPFIKYGGKRFIFTSSIAVYGALQTPFKETDKPEPEDLYGITKLAAEQTLEVMSKVHGFEYVIVRPHNVYGPRQNMRDPYRNVVTIWMNSLLRMRPYYIYGDGQQRRSFSYIGDVITNLYNCLTVEPNKIFNIGSNISYTLYELSALIQRATGSDVQPLYLPSRPQEVKNATADHALATKYLGECKTPLIVGLEKTWEWCKQQGPKEPLYTPIEIPSDKLPKNWI